MPTTVPTDELATVLGCTPAAPVAVEHRVELPDPGPSLLVSAHCESGAGSPPSAVVRVVATARADGTWGSEIAEVLVAAASQLQVQTLAVAAGRVRVVAAGYSTADVPRCCPDVRRTLTWSVSHGALVAQQPR
jgi:hypothetical protein